MQWRVLSDSPLFLLRLAQGFERENVNGDSHRQSSQYNAQPQWLNNCHNAVTHCQPQQTDRYDLCVQRYGVALSEIADIATEIGVVEQPVV